MQVFFGDRADCARRASADWFVGINPGSTKPGMAKIPEVNGKTKSRNVALIPGFCKLLQQWMTEPLQGGNGTCWPFENQTPKILNPKPLSPKPVLNSLFREKVTKTYSTQR